MSKKISNPEMLVAEIHTLQSKTASLIYQYKANNAKIERLQSLNINIKSTVDKKNKRLEELKIKAQQNGISF